VPCPGCIASDHEDRTRDRRRMLRASMYRERGTTAHITHLWILAHSPFGVARPEILGRKHLMLPFATIIPLCANRNLERPHVFGHINARQVERE
jgi:hypothetical protein